MSESAKKIKIDELPESSFINDEDIFIKSGQGRTTKITAKTMAEYMKNGESEKVQPDWNETDIYSDAYIKNKPTSMPANGGNADTVSGFSVNANVPENAKFTDTIYTHPDSGVAAGTYRSVAVDKQGHVTNGSNPTTLSGYGITDAATKAQGEKADTAVQSVKIGNTEYKSGTAVVLPGYPTTLPASDVYPWAKEVTKPTYTASEVGADVSGSATTAYENAKSYTDERITQLIGTSPENLDTIEELAAAISGNQSAIDVIEEAITNKADATHNHDELYASKASEHTHSNKTILDTITSEKISSWDSKSDFDGDYNSLTNIPTIPQKLSQLTNDAGYITSADVDTSQNHTHSNKAVLDTITQTAVDGWNSAKTHADSAHAPSSAEKNVIVGIQKNGTDITVDSATRKVNITVPTKISELTNDSGYKTTDNNTTYTLSKSGSTITLSGSDGTSTSVTDSDTTYSNFVKSGTGAKAGLVPAPSTTAGTTKYLREDGTWAVPPNTNTTYSNATTTTAGLMSAADKSKLDGVASGAEVNQNAFSNVVVGSSTVSADSKTDTLTLVAGSNVTLTPDVANDKITIASKDTVYAHPTTDGNRHVPANGTSNGGKYLKATSTAGTYEWGNITKSDVTTALEFTPLNIIYSTEEPTTVPAGTIVAVYEE